MHALITVLSFLILTTNSPNTMERESSIGARVSSRKRGLFVLGGSDGNDDNNERPSPRSRRKLLQENYTQDDVQVIKETFGHYQHHGTGNPLAKRAPSTPQDHAVTNLANIIQAGHVGKLAESNSIPQLKTERGNASDGSFWACRLRLAGSYGWTGLVLQENAKTSNPLPIEDVQYFLVESNDEMNVLRSKLSKAQWKQVQERVITVKQLADLARASGGGAK
jgi:hypothetical protein